ncbi:MAG: plasmid recombination protein [Clostridia bacterium]|nr:plasmid recombination protein [Clostridia bacterium]
MAQNEQPYAVFRFEKIKTYQQFAITIQHANRELDVPNADPSKANGYYKSTPLDVIKKRCEEARTRKDNVLGYDLLFTASPDFFVSAEFTKEISKKWQEETIYWIYRNFGKENVVNIALHLDETTPHITCQTLAIYNGKLNAKHFTGGAEKCSKLQDDYAKAVKNLGLQRGVHGSKAKHENIKKYYARVGSACEPTPPRSIKDLGLERDEPQRGLFGKKEDPEQYFSRTFSKYIAPKIQELLDENCRLQTENSNLKKEIAHWRKANGWTKRNVAAMQQLRSELESEKKIVANMRRKWNSLPQSVRNSVRNKEDRSR